MELGLPVVAPAGACFGFHTRKQVRFAAESGMNAAYADFVASRAGDTIPPRMPICAYPLRFTTKLEAHPSNSPLLVVQEFGRFAQTFFDDGRKSIIWNFCDPDPKFPVCFIPLCAIVFW